MHQRVFPSKIISCAMVLLNACSALAAAPAAAITATPGTRDLPPSPAESGIVVRATGTPPGPAPITLSNFQRVGSLYQWKLASDIVDVTGVALSPRAEQVALLALRYPEQYSLELRDPKTGDLIWAASLDAKAAYPAVAFSPDGNLIAAGLADGEVLVWNAADGSPSQTLTGSSYAIRAVAFSPDGSLIAASASDSTVRVWQVADGAARPPYFVKGNVGNLVFSPEGRYLAAASKVFTVFDLSSNAAAPAVYRDPGVPQAAGQIAFSPDGLFLIAEGKRNDPGHNLWLPRILLWDLQSHRSLPERIPIQDVIQDMVISPDGQFLLGYAPEQGLLEAVDLRQQKFAGTVAVGPGLFVEYSADLSRFVVVTKTSAALWGLSP